MTALRGRPFAVTVAALAASMCLVACGPVAAAPAQGAPGAVKHVFVIVLENKDYAETFGPDSPAPYLAHTLTGQGQLLTQYYGIGHASLDNYIAMISGQAPNVVTQSDCVVYADFVPPVAVMDANGQAVGEGCVFPAPVPTLPDQMDAAGLTWRGYMEEMGTPCRHPTLNTQDKTQSAKVGDQYAARHNPFMYFHSIVDDDARCRADVVDLADLNDDLQSTATTRNLTFITPSLCHDGHDKPCVDGQPGGLVSADAFLQEWVPKITSSPAYQQDGMLVVTFDEAEVGGAAAACCGEVAGPNSPLPGISGPGGGRTGAVVLSPFTAVGTTNDTPYNHYSLLRSIENTFGLPHLGFAARDGLVAFGLDVLNGAPAVLGTTETEAPRDEVSRAGPALDPASGTLPATGAPEPLVVASMLAATALVARLVRRRSRHS